MGVDLLEIQMSIEETFRIEITPEEMLGLVRDQDIVVGELYELLLQKLQLRDVVRNDPQMNYRLWIEMQSFLHSATGVPLDQIQLASPLEKLFPRKRRREMWGALRAACPYRVRELDYPRLVRVVGICLAVGMVVVEYFGIWKIPGANWLWPLLGLFGAWMVIETYLKILWFCGPLRNAFPSEIVTVKDLCRAVLAANYREIGEEMEIPLDDCCLRIWEQLTEILAEILGVEADTITFRSRLHRDFSMG